MTKEEILKEIRKYAKDIGKTPGEKNFYKNTEVTAWDRMKYWPNYGELVREAGLIPNKFDRTKYSHNQLCETFIEVIREKGKWPTRGELNVKHTYDSNFPKSVTFYNRLGLTGNLARSILEFIGDKQGYNDIIKICNSVLKEYEERSEPSEDSDMVSGFVYLGKQHGKYKIGKTKDLNRRREDITMLGSEPIDY